MRRLAFAALLAAAPVLAQDSTSGRGRGGRGAAAAAGGGRLWTGPMDSVRARQLYVSRDTGELAGCGTGCDRQIKAKHETDSVYAARAAGRYEFQKVKYKSRPDGLEIPAYLFSPISKSSAKHAALVWVHGYVHGDWNTLMYPFVVEAVKRGYVVLTPDYRGSTGYGNDWYRMIDYGGKEVDDVLSAVDYLATVPGVDSKRLGIMGWSHGGFITSHILFRDDNPFKAGAAIVPVTNLIFRLSDHGPAYARDYAAESGIGG
ncbi:MAG TPA: alpha/beta fold hydrolase, partial [Gemmatimonadaceae bacterium]|nr:alpha/beta fold hydrolase [Gemmatimonadaceae bacterium]